MNETACATVNQIVEWLKVKGADAALNVLLAAVMLVAGWFLIRLIANGLRTALTRGGQKEPRRLMVTFIVSVVEKACWAILGVMVLARLGVNVGPLIAGLGAGGFIVGFACLQLFMGASSNFTVSTAAQYWRREDFPSAFSFINPLANLISAFGPMIIAGIGFSAGFHIVWIVIGILGVLALVLTIAFRPARILNSDKRYRREAGLPEEGISKSAAELMGEK